MFLHCQQTDRHRFSWESRQNDRSW